MDITTIQERLHALKNAEAAALSARYFKTGPGQYGEGDLFLGIRVPVLRKLAAEFQNLPMEGADVLLRSPYHEARSLALLILTRRFPRAERPEQKQIFDFYMSMMSRINNWDLVDVSAPEIVGGYLMEESRSLLDSLAASTSLWERRISIIATLHYIRKGECTDTIRIAGKLRDDPEDLIHKAVGWMLREVSKRDRALFDQFLNLHVASMPRTMLRYAIERLPGPELQALMKRGRKRG